MRFLFYLFAIALLLPSCKTVKGGKQKLLKKRSVPYLMEKLNTTQKSVEWLSSKASIKYKDEAQRLNLTANIRIKKDSVIWMNFKKLGVEAVRLQITPDSIYLINRLDKTYSVKGMNFIHKQFDFPYAIKQHFNFQAIQNIFLGNPVFTAVQEMKAERTDLQYQLSGAYDDVVSTYWLNGITYELEQMLFLDNHDKKQLQLNFADYNAIEEGKYFSYFRTINISSQQTGTIDLRIQLSKTEIDTPKTLRFDIPKHYTRVD